MASRPESDDTPLTQHDAPRARHRWLLEFGSPGEFADPSLEYRRLFAETLGTFMLVLVAGGGGILHSKGQVSLAAVVVAPGLMVMAIILFMGAVSGAHLNPAASIAFALRGDFPGGEYPDTWPPRCWEQRWRACSCLPSSETSAISARPYPVRRTGPGRHC